MRKHSGDSLEEGSFVDLGTMHFEDEEYTLAGAKSTVRVGEIFRYEDLHAITKYVYNGDILVIDYTSISTDQLAVKRMSSELRNISNDTKGDVAGIAKNLIMITPSGVRIDRNKIRPGLP
jgi:hypothetical protein